VAADLSRPGPVPERDLVPDHRGLRNIGTDATPEWRLVELRDLSSGPGAAFRLSTQTSTWGAIKALYRE
jgi:hypothetical protein